MKKDSKSESEILRQKAEEFLNTSTPLGVPSTNPPINLSEAEMLKLVHELEVHQVELELLNEELTRAISRVQDAADKYTELYDFAPSGYFTLSKEGMILELNLAGAQMLGKERLHLINRPFGFFVADDTKPIFYIFLTKVLNSKIKETCEITLSTKINIPMFVLLTGIGTENGEQCHINLVDITERKRAEEDLSRANIFLDSIVENIPDMIFLKDANTLRFVRINKAGENLLGISGQELLGKNDSNFFSKEQAGFFMEKDMEVLSSNEMKDIPEEPIQTKHKGIRILHTKKVPILSALGKPEYLLGISEDITDHKQKEQELIIAKQHAEESDRLKSAFLANMSHEIRTPMNGILGFAGLLKEPNLTGEEQQKYIRIIEKSGDRMLNIISEIVDISKIESGQMDISISKTNLNEQIEYIYAFFRLEAEKKGIQFFVKNLLPAKDVIINTDSEKINAILTNLVKNAIKYTNKGSIELGYNLVETLLLETLHTTSLMLQFFIKDTGIGIPKTRQEAIFERFIQADISDKQAYQGAGLGLAIAKAYVEMLGGKIWVESEEGSGSIFYFTIPYNTEPEEKKFMKNVVLPEDKEGYLKNLKILIADDDETSEMFIMTTVKKISREVLIAITGVEAVEMCRNNPDIDLVLMDIRMPEMNGYDAIRQIRQFNKDVIIIAQTAHALIGDREKAIEAGCDDYISKPIDGDLLMGLINKHY